MRYRAVRVRPSLGRTWFITLFTALWTADLVVALAARSHGQIYSAAVFAAVGWLLVLGISRQWPLFVLRRTGLQAPPALDRPASLRLTVTGTTSRTDLARQILQAAHTVGATIESLSYHTDQQVVDAQHVMSLWMTEDGSTTASLVRTVRNLPGVLTVAATT